MMPWHTTGTLQRSTHPLNAASSQSSDADDGHLLPHASPLPIGGHITSPPKYVEPHKTAVCCPFSKFAAPEMWYSPNAADFGSHANQSVYIRSGMRPFRNCRLIAGGERGSTHLPARGRRIRGRRSLIAPCLADFFHCLPGKLMT